MRSARCIPDAPMYTFWDYMRKRWERDAGLRLDQILLSRDLRERLVEAGVDRAVRGKPDASDHAPVWVVLRDGGKRDRARHERAARSRRARRSAGRSSAASPTAKARPTPAAAGDRRRFVRAPLLSRAAEDHPAGGQAAGRRHPRLRQLPAEILSERAAARRAGGLGHARTRRPTGTKLSRPTRADASSTTRCVEQLDILPELVAACGFANAKKAGYEADDFLAAAATRGREARRHRAGRERRPRHVPARLGRDHDPLSGARRRGRAHHARRGARPATASTPRRCRISSRCAAIPRTSCRARANIGPQGAADVLRRHGSLEGRARGRPLCDAGEGAAALSLDRHHGPQGAAAAPARPDADLVEGGGARPQMAAQPARRPVRQDG